MVHVLDMITLCPADTLPKLAPAQACIDNASNKSEESTSFIRLVSTTFSKACQKLLQGCFLLFLTHTGETATRSRNMCVCDSDSTAKICQLESVSQQHQPSLLNLGHHRFQRILLGTKSCTKFFHLGRDSRFKKVAMKQSPG